LTPTRVGSDQVWRKVFAGTSHTLAINSLGELWAWGSNEFGQVGDGTFDDVVTPKKIGVANNWLSISANLHCLAINTDGQLFSWGRNDIGQLGLNLTTTVTTSSSTDTSGTTSATSTIPLYQNQNSPKAITRDQNGTVIDNAGTLENWKAASAGYQHSLIVSQAGELFTAGSNQFGQIGRSESNTFQKLGSERNWNRVAAGNFHSIVLSAAGDMYAMGRNTYGQLGNGSTDNITTLTLISTDFDWDLPEAGYDFTAAIGNIKAAELADSTEVELDTTMTIAAGDTSVTQDSMTLAGTAEDALSYNVPASVTGTPFTATLFIGGSAVAQITAPSAYDQVPARFTRGGTSYNFTITSGNIDL
jgi:alpha-tubulin suppressor-like RCC1 family protein